MPSSRNAFVAAYFKFDKGCPSTQANVCRHPASGIRRFKCQEELQRAIDADTLRRPLDEVVAHRPAGRSTRRPPEDRGAAKLRDRCRPQEQRALHRGGDPMPSAPASPHEHARRQPRATPRFGSDVKTIRRAQGAHAEELGILYMNALQGPCRPPRLRRPRRVLEVNDGVAVMRLDSCGEGPKDGVRTDPGLTVAAGHDRMHRGAPPQGNRAQPLRHIDALPAPHESNCKSIAWTIPRRLSPSSVESFKRASANAG